jgi:YD repeat-containing protein
MGAGSAAPTAPAIRLAAPRRIPGEYTVKHASRTLAVLALALVSAGELKAQVDSTVARPGAQPARRAATIGTRNYDVVLEVPELRVDSIGLRVDDLRAGVALQANVANLVSVDAGVRASIDSVALDITGVYAQAFLYVDLDNVARIVDRVVTTLERNPRLVTQLLSTVDSAVGTVGGVANEALRPGGAVGRTLGTAGQTLNTLTAPGGVLSQTVNTLGQTVQTTLDNSGNLVERTLDTAGRAVGTRTLGSLTSLPVLRQTTNAAGQTVRQVRDTAGRTVEYTVDAAGRVLGARVLGGSAPRR